MEDQAFQIQRMLADKLNAYKDRENSYMLWDAWTLNNFYFILFYFLWFYFSFSLFYFPGKDDEEGMWQGSHMTDHMMRHHKPRTW